MRIGCARPARLAQSDVGSIRAQCNWSYEMKRVCEYDVAVRHRSRAPNIVTWTRTIRGIPGGKCEGVILHNAGRIVAEEGLPS